MRPGFHVKVLPGFQRLNGMQRESLLELAEDGQLESPIRVHADAHGDILAVDRQGRTHKLHRDGSTTPGGQ